MEKVNSLWSVLHASFAGRSLAPADLERMAALVLLIANHPRGSPYPRSACLRARLFNGNCRQSLLWTDIKSNLFLTLAAPRNHVIQIILPSTSPHTWRSSAFNGGPANHSSLDRRSKSSHHSRCRFTSQHGHKFIGKPRGPGGCYATPRQQAILADIRQAGEEWHGHAWMVGLEQVVWTADEPQLRHATRLDLNGRAWQYFVGQPRMWRACFAF